MKIVAYTNLYGLFGEIAEGLCHLLRKQGHSCEVITLRRGWDMPIPTIPDVDVELYFSGFTIFNILAKYEHDSAAKKIVWVFEPLTMDRKAEVHGFKADKFRSVSSKFHGVIAMDSLVAKYIVDNEFGLPLCTIPYALPKHCIWEPVSEQEKEIDVLWLARMSEASRRAEAKKEFIESGIPLTHICGGLDGHNRDMTIARSKISLQVHSDSYGYFDQYRIFNAWAKGSVVVSEPCLNKSLG